MSVIKRKLMMMMMAGGKNRKKSSSLLGAKTGVVCGPYIIKFQISVYGVWPSIV